jgi:hypothetical protein
MRTFAREKEGNHHKASPARLAVGVSLHQFYSDFELSVSGGWWR